MAQLQLGPCSVEAAGLATWLWELAPTYKALLPELCWCPAVFYLPQKTLSSE